MSTYAEQPFTEFEERYFLAEILKKSALPPSTLLAIIRDARIDPAWNDIALPNGRSVSACQQAYHSLSSRTPLPPPQPSPVGPVEPARGLKRPYSSLGDATTALPRELQPRPPTFTTVNGQPIAIPPPQPPPLMMSPVEPQRKKRGRPTKAEWERRQAEAQERGEVWPKPRKAKPKPAAESPESSKAAAGRAGPSPAASPPKGESASYTGAPLAPMQTASAPPPPSQPPLPPPGQEQSYVPSMERRVGEPPVHPQQTEIAGSERRPEPPQQPAQGPPAQAGQPGGGVGHQGGLHTPYRYTSQPQSEASPMDVSPQPGYQQREAPPESRRPL